MAVGYRFLLSVAVVLLLGVQEASAFFVPSAIQLLGVSLSNILSYILIISSVFFISMFGVIKTHLRRKKVFLSILGILLVLLVSWPLYTEYTGLKDYNVKSEEEGTQDELRFYNSAFGQWSLDENNNSVNLSFEFFKDHGENSSEIFTFSHEGSRLDEDTVKGHAMPMMETMMKSEQVCVEGHVNEKTIDECSPDCTEFGRGSCFYVYVMDIFDNLMSDEFSRDFDINELSYEEISEYVIITPHLSNDTVAEFTNLEVDGRIWIDALSNMEYFKTVLEPYQNETILFMCFAGHSSSVMATMANLLGFDAVHAAFQDITNDDIIDVEGLSETNQENTIIINDHSKRERSKESLYLKIEGLLDDNQYGEDVEPVTGRFEEGSLVFPDIEKDELLDSNIVCGTLLSCRLTQYWLSDLGLAGDIDVIYLYDHE
ncbi:MAG: hypothetical protein ACLFSL_01870 [Candidatus Woesearchaeota archaeon]